MKYYFAGAANEKAFEVRREEKVERILLSYLDIRKNIDKVKDFSIFLDSGAFSAFTLGKVINLQEYIDYIKKNKDKFVVYANLDDISSSQKTLENQEKMESQGLNPLPCFHFGEDFGLLKEYADKYNYIALGGLVPYAKEYTKLTNFLDKVFSVLVPYIKEKKLKVHGFGVGSPAILTRYPFYSADSTSWISGGTFGTLVVWDTQKYKFVSSFHYGEKDKMMQNNVDIKTLENYKERFRHNIKEFLKMEKDITYLWKKRGISWD